MTESVQDVGGTRCEWQYCGSIEQMNAQRDLFREFILYVFELSHNTAEARKKICYAKGEGAVDHNIVYIGLEKFR